MKNNIITIILIILIGMIAFWYLGQKNTSTGYLSVDAQSTDSADAKYIYNLLQQMESVTLDDSIFTNSVFQNLRDNTVSFSAQPSGRNNPFAPVGTDVIVNGKASTTINGR